MRCVNCGYDNSEGRTNCLKCGQALGGGYQPSYQPSYQSSYQPSFQTNDSYGNERVTKRFTENEVVPKPTVLNVNRMDQEAANRKTVVLNQGKEERNPQNQAPKTQAADCPSCGYPLVGNTGTCPSCGMTLKNHPSGNEQAAASVKNVAAASIADRMIVCQECKQEIPITSSFCSFCGSKVHPSTVLPSMKKINLPHCCLTMMSETNELVRDSKKIYEGDAIELNRLNTEVDNRSITTQKQAVLICEEGEWYIENHSLYQTTYIAVNRKMKLEEGDVIMLGDRKFKFEKE